ncbi:MAG: DNA topoisomerase (ATP-hydrolyzing) [Candidatus Limiplasma sp.]|nr:DNA topoisomerase (ATP-hydrolyzing) [Candidatus Limiplasma sp.]
MRGKDIEIPVDQGIIQTPMEEVMHNSMIPYAEHVILERAVPRVEDGLKPVQRRILYTMSELSLGPDTPHRKCARIVGDCLGKYHPHGDSSVYDALVRLAQDFSMRGMLVNGHGNFGSIDGDSAAAMRYTEARMTPLATQMLRDIEKDTVPFRLNFDDTLKEPDMLPARFPNLLVNGASGIAVGLATNIPPHNLREAVQAVIAQIDNPDITVEELMALMPAPDFPTGGVLLDTPELKAAYATGKGKLLLRARVQVEDGSAGRKLIVITEVPYQVSKAAMLEKILKLSEEKKTALGGIYDIRDESDRTGLRAVIELRKEADVDKTLAYLYKYSDMQVTFGVNMVAIAEGKPKLLSLRRMIRYYIRHQKNVVTARTQYDLDHARARAHVLEGLMIAVDNLDEVIALIRGSENPKAAKAGLMERFSLTEIQAQAILDLRLQRLTGLEILALRKEYAEVLKLIEKLEAILADERKLLKVIKDELREVADRLGDERRTTLVKAEQVIEAIKEEAVAEEAIVTFSQAGYLRRMYPKHYRRLPPISLENENLEDAPRFLFETDTDKTLAFFTNLGNCYLLGVGALPEMNRPKERGSLLTGVLAGFETGEEIVHMLCFGPGELQNKRDLLFVTRQGTLKRSAAKEYDVRRQKFAALTLRPGDSLLAVVELNPELDMLCLSRNGMSIRFHTDNLPVMGRVTGGVKGMTLEPGDEVLWVAQPQPTDQVLLISERGFAKRILFLDFEPQARGGKGVKSFYFNKSGSNGTRIAGALLLGQQPSSVLVFQKKSPPTVLDGNGITPQGKQDKGMPYLMALLDDVVTGVQAYAAPEGKADEGDWEEGENP